MSFASPADVRFALLVRQEIAPIDVREGASFALTHPLFAARMSFGQIEIDAYVRKHPYEGTDNDAAVTQAYLDWEYGLIEQLARDGTHGFFTIAQDH